MITSSNVARGWRTTFVQDTSLYLCRVVSYFENMRLKVRMLRCGHALAEVYLTTA